MRVLIVEDAVCMAKVFENALSAQGHEVVWVIGFKQLQPLVAIAPDTTEVQLESKFDVALVDGQLKGAFEGPAVVSALLTQGVTCIGISSTTDLNAQMRANGATLAMNKAVALGAVFSGKLPLEQANAPTDELRWELEQFATGFLNKDYEALRRQLDALVMQYM